MKGNEQVINHLNARLAEELTAINQYFVHAEMCENWGYKKLHAMVFKRSIQEMKHAEKLIARILFLDGIPIVSKINKIHIGSEIPKMYKNDHAAEAAAISGYNESIRVAMEAGDNGSRELLASILKEEEEHIDLIEAQIEQISQMGIQNYLVDQTD
ncbi:MAG: bacterioferritin [Desulfuromonadaceae bacterium]